MKPSPRTRAFTRVELLASFCTLALAGLFGRALIASSSGQSDLAVCWNNLRQIGRACNMWAADYGGENPWLVDARVGGLRFPLEPFDVPGIGRFPAAVNQSAWFHFLWMRDELRSPGILTCPSDTNRKRATDFSNNPTGGLAHLGFQHQAVSYFLSLHALSELPSSVLSGDRNIIGRYPYSCSVMPWAYGVAAGSGAQTGWTNGLHSASGNLGFNDGSVRHFSTGELTTVLETNRPAFNADIGAYHLLMP